MKLTAEQSKYIIDYLINEGLEYKEFIDEMHDHLIDSIEAKMSDGLNFAQALGETGGAFETRFSARSWASGFREKILKSIC
jgi:hypothetical protein